MGSGAIAMSLPFSCILGLLASMTATTMGEAFFSYFHSSQCILEVEFLAIYINSSNFFLVRRNHVWIYGTMQFGLVVLAGHLLYSLVRNFFLQPYKALL
jgi:hypothetical protein